MKLVPAATLVLIFIVLKTECRPRKRKYEPEETCTAELRLNRAQMKALVNEDNTAEDKTVQAEFLLCVFKKRAVMGESGEVRQKKLSHFVRMLFREVDLREGEKEEAVQHVLQNCSNKQRSMPEKTAIALKNCLVRHVREFEADF